MSYDTIFNDLYDAEWNRSVARANKAYAGADGEHIAGQVFANLWARRESLDWSRPGALLTTSLTNAIIDARRAFKRTDSLYTPDGTLHDVPAPISEDSAAGRLATVLDELTPDQRAVLVMRADELSFREIAERLNITEDAAKKLARRGRARLERAAA